LIQAQTLVDLGLGGPTKGWKRALWCMGGGTFFKVGGTTKCKSKNY